MKRYQLKIMGRSCVVAAEKDEHFMREMETRVNEELTAIRRSMPNADYIDVFIACICALSERLEDLDRKLLEMKDVNGLALRKIGQIRADITRELEKLTSPGKMVKL